MKKIISVLAIIALVALIFTLAACGTDNGGSTGTTSGSTSSTTDKMTSMKDEGSSMLDDMSSALGDLADDLTENGNVTDNDSTTGLLEGLTSNNTDEAESNGTTNAADTTAAAE